MTAMHVYGFHTVDQTFHGEETIIIKETRLDTNILHYVLSRILLWAEVEGAIVMPFWHFA